MIDFLIGSDERATVHLHVVSSAGQVVPWRTGVSYGPAQPGTFELAADADLLGKGVLDISTVSLIRATDDELRNPYAPQGRTGDPVATDARLHMDVVEAGGVVRAALALSVDFAAAGVIAAPSPYLSGVRLFVHTHTMGRAQMIVNALECRFL